MISAQTPAANSPPKEAPATAPQRNIIWFFMLSLSKGRGKCRRPLIVLGNRSCRRLAVLLLPFRHNLLGGGN